MPRGKKPPPTPPTPYGWWCDKCEVYHATENEVKSFREGHGKVRVKVTDIITCDVQNDLVLHWTAKCPYCTLKFKGDTRGEAGRALKQHLSTHTIEQQELLLK